LASDRCGAELVLDNPMGAAVSRRSFTLRNTSSKAKNRATRIRVTLEPTEKARRIASPAGWTAFIRLCSDGERMCGVEWQNYPGLPAGGVESRFAVETSPPERLRVEVWGVDLEECSVGGLEGGAVG
jgi:hypothetical protein